MFTNVSNCIKNYPKSHNNVFGMNGELALIESFENFADGFLIANPVFNFDSWKKTQGRGADAELHLDDSKFTIEMKNRASYQISKTKFLEEDLARFEMADPNYETLWIEVVSHANFTDKVWNLISKHNIIIIEIGFQIKSSNFEEAKQIIAKELSRKLGLRGYDLTLVLDTNTRSGFLSSGAGFSGLVSEPGHFVLNFTNFIVKKLGSGLDLFRSLAVRIGEVTKLT